MTTATPTSLRASLRLWQLISPSLPVGAYAYSSGLEQVVETGRVRSERDAAEWIEGVLHGLARTDLPILLRVHGAVAARDLDEAIEWCRTLVAMRETAELRAADRHMGQALACLLEDLGLPMPRCDWPFAGAYAFGAAHGGVSAVLAAAGYAWAWCESHVAAAIKLVPLGHTAGQKILLGLGPAIEAAVVRACRLDDAEIGYSMPGLAIASARHETQHTRLFRS